MDRLSQELAAAREHVDVRWDQARAAQVYAGIAQLRRRRQVARVASGGAMVSAVAVMALMLWGGKPGDSANVSVVQVAATSEQPTASVIGTVRAAHRLRLADGSTTRLVGDRSELDILENDPENVALRLRSGTAQFDVVPNKARRFVVSAGEIDVIVVGTAFEVERRNGAVSVAVQHGRVRVVGPDGVRYLETGQARRFVGGGSEEVVEESPASGAKVAAPAPELPTTHRIKRTRGRRVAHSGGQRLPSAGWRKLVEDGDHAGAYAAIAGGAQVPNEPAALLDAADAARLSGNPVAATRYLEQVVEQHAKSPVAPLAAFTLGRVLLDRLGQPHRAARAFERARALAPSGSLAQDALAREVEALSKGGEMEGARNRALRYRQLYPAGRRLRAVQHYGGL